MNQELRVSAIFEKPFRPEAIVRLIEVEILAPAAAKRHLMPTRHLPSDSDTHVPHPMMEPLLGSEPDAPRDAGAATGVDG